MLSRRKLLTAGAAAVIVAMTPRATRVAGERFVTAKHGTLRFDGQKLVIEATAGFNDLQARIGATFPRGGPGGIIEFAPGVHRVFLGPLRSGSFWVRGAEGSRPTVTAQQPDGRPADLVSYGPKQSTPGTYVILDNLEVTDSRQAMSTHNQEGVICRNCYIHDNAGPARRWSRPDATGDASGPAARFGWGEVIGTAAGAPGVMEIARSGGSPRHNVYINGLAELYVTGLFIHSSSLTESER